MPVGTNTYMGLAVPRYGESEIMQESAQDVLTFQHSSANAGNFLVLRDKVSSGTESSLTGHSSLYREVNAGEGASGTDQDLFKIDGSGSLVGVSTVLGDNLFNGWRQPVVETTVDVTLTEADSGTLYVVSTAVATSMTFELPTGSGVPGTWYDFFVSTLAATGDVRIAASSLVAADIHLPGATSIVSTFAAITPENVLGAHFCRLTAATSLLWIMEHNGTYSSQSTLGQGNWIAGSTG